MLRAALILLGVYEGSAFAQWTLRDVVECAGSKYPGVAVSLEQSAAAAAPTVAVPEANVAGIATGTRVEFTVPAQAGKKFTGVIARAARALNAKTRTMAVEADVNNAGGVLGLGMYAEVVWPVKRGTPGLFVPATAVVTTTGKVFVLRVNGGRAEWVAVIKGAKAGDLVEVQGKLSAGDVVVKRGSDEIREGQRIGA